MKKIFFNLTIITGIVLLSLPLQAQQLTTAKPPEVKGPVLQTGTENKVAAPATATAEKDLHQTATKQSSATGEPKPVKVKDEVQPAKAPQIQQQLPETNKIIPPPGNPIKNG